MKINSMKMLYCIALIGVFLIYSKINLAQICDCKEFLYVNDAGQAEGIHKFEINENFVIGVDLAPSIIVQEIGNPWYDNVAEGETLSDPHGLGIDLNGQLYIGEEANPNAIRQLNCVGDITPSGGYEISNEGGFSFASSGNTLFVNSNPNDNAVRDGNVPNGNAISAYDLCTGELLGYYCMQDIAVGKDWGLFLDDDGTMYVTSDFYRDDSSKDVPNQLYKFDINTAVLNAPGENNPVCIAPFISESPASIDPMPGDNFLPPYRLFGVVADSDGNIFIVEKTGATRDDNVPANFPEFTGRILKYDSNGNFVSATPWDFTEDGTGNFNNVGIVYAETVDLLFVSTESPIDPCVALYDTDLNYLGPAIPAPPNSTGSKGIALVTECCPPTNLAPLDTTLCEASIGDVLFLQDLVDICQGESGIVCEGNWQGGNANITFNDCNNSITVNNFGCADFDLTSDGMAANAICSPFQIMVSICVYDKPTPPVISVTDNVCNPVLVTSGSINVDTPCPAGSTIEYSIDGGINWSATAPVYDNDNPITVQARCVSDGSAQCVSAASIVTSAPDPLCCPAQTCIRQFGEFTIIKRRP